MVKVGDSIPQVGPLEEGGPGQKVSLPTSGKYILSLVPGAFTTPCSNQVPGFVENEKAFASKGYDKIYVVAVNDAFVVTAWKEHLAKSSGVHFLADPTGHFTNALDLLFDASGLLGNHRAKRAVLAVEDGKVKSIVVEDEAPNITVTKADNVLASL
ncbi:hypothetical protein PYCC9005_005176 [Savitreella phatthalungensis]